MSSAESKSPLFSVVIPAYNRASSIGKIINAVIGQKSGDWELIIVDDGSTDETRKVVQSFEDKRIRYHYQENAGVCAARNKGAKLANGRLLTFVDSDDWVSEDWLADFARVFEEHQVDVVICDRTLTSEPGVARNRFLAGTFAISKALFLKVSGYDEAIRFGENTELKWRLDESGAPALCRSPHIREPRIAGPPPPPHTTFRRLPSRSG